MPEVFERWRKRRWTANGVELTLRDAPGAGYVHVAPRVRTLRPARVVVELARAELSRCARDIQISHAERIVTNEGEHAVLVSLTAVAGDQQIGRELGIVFTDDFTAIIDAAFNTRHATEFRSFVVQLIRELPLCADRARRRIEFRPPRGWASRSRGLLTHVFAPSYSADGTLLSVLPAEPRGLDSMIKSLVYEDVVDNLEDIELLPNQSVTFGSGLSGDLVTVRGRVENQPTMVQAIILDDHKHRYTVRLSSRSYLAPEDVILPVASSIRPIPDRVVANPFAVSHFAD